MSAKAKKLYKSEGKNQQPEEPGTIEVTEEESPTEIEASSDEDVPMDNLHYGSKITQEAEAALGEEAAGVYGARGQQQFKQAS